MAGTLDLAWTPIADPELAGYRLHIGSSPGRYDRVIEAPENRLRLEGLEDGRVYFMRVEAVSRSEQDGLETLSLSPELASLPRPVVTAVGPLMPAGDGTSFLMRVEGSSFSPEAFVRLSNPALRVLSTAPAPGGALEVRVALVAGPGLPLIGPPDVTVVNPGLKAPEYLLRNGARADVNGDGRIDATDSEAVRQAVGLRAGAAGFERAADLNGDGQVDGADLALIEARLTAAR